MNDALAAPAGQAVPAARTGPTARTAPAERVGQAERDEQNAADDFFPIDESRDCPETRFRLGPITRDDDGLHVAMRTGIWTAGADGAGSVGALGVMIDNALGMTVFAARPDGCHSVTAELSLDVLAPPPTAAGHRLVATATLLGRDRTSGLARCNVLDDTGTLIAFATARCQFVPRGGIQFDGGMPPFPADQRAGRPTLETLGARVEAGADGTPRLVMATSAGFSNGGGAVHGGALLCGSDLLAAAVTPPDQRGVTASIRMSFLRPALLTEPVVFTAEVVHRGRSVSILRVTSAGSAGRPYTVALITRRRTDGLAGPTGQPARPR